MLIRFLMPDFINEGERGKLVQLVHGGFRQVNVITSDRSAVRGGHYHKYNEECFYVVSGAFMLTLSLGSEREEYHMAEGAMFAIPPYVFHTFEFSVDTVLVSLYTSGVELSETQKDIWTE